MWARVNIECKKSTEHSPQVLDIIMNSKWLIINDIQTSDYCRFQNYGLHLKAQTNKSLHMHKLINYV